MLDRIPRPVYILALLALFALGLALGLNAVFAKMLAVDPDRLAAIQNGTAPPNALASSGDRGSKSRDATGDVQGRGNKARERGTAKSSSPYRLASFMTPIVNRNLFDSTNALAGKKEEVVTNDDESLVVSELDVTLVSASVASDPSWSTALVATGSDLPELYRLGDAVLTAELIDIRAPFLTLSGEHQAARIIVLNEGRREYIEAGGERKKGSARKKGGGDAEEKPAKKRSSGRHTWDGITDLGGGKYGIEQSELDYALSNLDKLSREARIVPNFADGATNGFKVFSIRRNSALRKMGLKNNDVLTAVNGFDLSNTEKAMEIYAKLLSEKSFTLEVLRNGEPTSLEYNVQ